MDSEQRGALFSSARRHVCGSLQAWVGASLRCQSPEFTVYIGSEAPAHGTASGEQFEHADDAHLE